MNAILIVAALKVLAIGNSFSVCPQHELPQVAKSLGCELDLVTMTIGGCSLERHWQCLTKADDLTYGLDWNRCGVKQGDWPELKALQKPVERTHWKTHKKYMGTGANLEAVLKAVKFDVITVQQASHFSWQPDTYVPWGDQLVAKVREFQPQAEIVVQETWSYTPWDGRLAKWKIDQNEMYAKLHDAYGQFAKKYGFRVIPTGTAVQLWRKELPVKYAENSFGGDVVGGGRQDERDHFKRGADGKWVPNCDVFHLGRKGEYFQALVWARTLFGVDLGALKYKPDFVTDSDAKLMREIATELK